MYILLLCLVSLVISRFQSVEKLKETFNEKLQEKYADL